MFIVECRQLKVLVNQTYMAKSVELDCVHCESLTQINCLLAFGFKFFSHVRLWHKSKRFSFTNIPGN